MHTTQFNVGVGSHFFANTTNNDCFKDHTGQTTAVHTDRARWVNQMSGKDMLDCTQHKDSRTVSITVLFYVIFLLLSKVYMPYIFSLLGDSLPVAKPAQQFSHPIQIFSCLPTVETISFQRNNNDL